MIPPSVRAAIAEVGFTVCGYCGPVEIVPDEVRERPRICHAYADCPHVLFPDSEEAVELARSVDDELGDAVRLGIDPALYGEPEPVHTWGLP
jgi:hypothetical protein